MPRDPYETLGVRPDASAEAIKAAYRRMARATHPDSGDEPFAFRAIQEAFDLLNDPSRRATFDATDSPSEPPPAPPRSKPPPSQHSSTQPSRPSPPRPSNLATPSWIGQIPDSPATVTPGRGVDWAERAIMPVCTMLLLLAATWAPITGSGPLWTLGAIIYIVAARPWSRVPMHRRLVAPGLLLAVATIAWTVLLPSTLTTGQVLTVITPPVLTILLAIAGTAWLRAWLTPARHVTITAARQFNAFWPAGTITPDDDVAEFANLFTTIPSARLIHEHRGARTWVLVGRRAVAFTENSGVDLSGLPSALEVQVHSYRRHLLPDLQGSLDQIGAWLLEGEHQATMVDRRQLGLLAS